jgi:hypothetical protein
MLFQRHYKFSKKNLKRPYLVKERHGAGEGNLPQSKVTSLQ